MRWWNAARGTKLREKPCDKNLNKNKIVKEELGDNPKNSSADQSVANSF